MSIASVQTEEHGRFSAEVADFTAAFNGLVNNIEEVVHGKTEAVKTSLTCLFAEGHLLIEDVPGVGKTLLARSLAASVTMPCQRIQFTPDLLPADVTGSLVYDQRNHRFDFRRGPIFTGMLIADEINRASPRTQSALLEAMEEDQVTVDTESHPLPRPFLVVATENPVDMQGTYPLPEAQLDRFLIRTRLDYPVHQAEAAILADARRGFRRRVVSPMLTAEDVIALIDVARRVEVVPIVDDYIVSIVNATRDRTELRLGASPRGSIGLMRAAQVRAAASGRTFVSPDDVKELALPVLAHRVLRSVEAERQDISAEDVLDDILRTVAVPREPGSSVWP